MCHVSRLNREETERLNMMSREYREKLEYALENGTDDQGLAIQSRRASVKPIFERIYSAWVDRETARVTARTLAEGTTSGGMPTTTYDPKRPFTTGVLTYR